MEPMAQTDTASGITVLVAEDDPVLRILMADLLEDEGFTVLLADDGDQADAILQRRVVDLLITDHRMPKLLGADLARRVLGRYPCLPIILYSANDTPDVPTGVVFVPKPFGLDHILAEAHRLLAKA